MILPLHLFVLICSRNFFPSECVSYLIIMQVEALCCLPGGMWNGAITAGHFSDFGCTFSGYMQPRVHRTRICKPSLMASVDQTISQPLQQLTHGHFWCCPLPPEAWPISAVPYPTGSERLGALVTASGKPWALTLGGCAGKDAEAQLRPGPKASGTWLRPRLLGDFTSRAATRGHASGTCPKGPVTPQWQHQGATWQAPSPASP